MVQLSVLIAIMLLLELTGLGMIKTAGLEITIMLVPVIVGAIVMGPAAGALLGGVFGLISFWECFGKSSFGVVLLGINPIYTFLVCVPTRILAGWLCGLAFKGLNKLDKTNWLPAFTAALERFKSEGFERVNPSILKATILNDYPGFEERQIGFKRFSDVMKKLEKEGVKDPLNTDFSAIKK